MSARRTAVRLAAVALALGAVLWLAWRGSDALPAPDTCAAPAATAEPAAAEEAGESVPPIAAGSATAPAPATPAAANAAPAPAKEPPKPPVLRGRVTDSYGNRLPGVGVEAHFRRGAMQVPIGTTESAAGGAYALALPEFAGERAFAARLRAEPSERGRSARSMSRELARLELLDGPRKRPGEKLELARALAQPLELVATASVAGFAPVTVARPLALPLRADVVVDFELDTAEVVRGNVLYETERGTLRVPGATVLLIDAADALAASTATDEDGAWTLYVGKPGRYRLFARRAQLGTAFEEAFDFAGGGPARAPDLTLRGDARFAGRVVFPDGTPVPALALELRHEVALPALEDGLGEVERALLERGEGCVLGEGFTNEDGRFRCGGLRLGSFALRFADTPDSELQPRGVFTAGPGQHEVVFAGHRLRVFVRTNEQDARDAPQIACAHLAQSGRGEPQPVAGRWSEDERWYATVEVGERYLVRAWASGEREDWAVVAIGALSYQTELELDLFAPPKADLAGFLDWQRDAASHADVLGRLELRVVDEHGLRVKDGWRASLIDLDTRRTPRGFERFRTDAQAPAPTLAPGRYELRVVADSPKSMLVLPAEPQRFELAAGRTAVVEVQAQRGGRVRLTTLAPQDMPGIEQVLATRARFERWSVRAFARPQDGDASARVALAFLDTAAVRAEFALAEPGAWLPLGAASECAPPLAPGEWVVTVESGAGARREYKVAVQAGQLAELDFGLPR